MKKLLVSVITLSLVVLLFIGCGRIKNVSVPVSIKWRLKTSASNYYTPVIVDNVIYMGGQFDFIYAVDKDTGKLKWKFYDKNSELSSSSVVDGVVYVVGTRTF